MTYYVYSPFGNTTALIEGAHSDRVALSKHLMEHDADIEQVGFIEELPGQYPFLLRMAGDEFCGNAALAAVAHWQRTHGTEPFSFFVSGLAAPVRAVRDGERIGLLFPDSLFTKKQTIPEGTLVDLAGIRFIVSEEQSSKDDIEHLLRAYGQDVPAIGYIAVTKHKDIVSIVPHVRVADIGTTLTESACASGTMALALLSRETTDRLKVRQPSGDDILVGFTGGKILFAGVAPFVDERLVP